MLDNTQRQIVINRLRQTNQISRNWCLKNYISRLSAIILDLKHKGWVFKPKRDEGDYIYILERMPLDDEIEYSPQQIKINNLRKQKILC